MIIAVTDRNHCIRPFYEQLRLIAEAGPDLVIIRDKGCGVDGFRDFAESCIGICSGYGVEICINTYCEIAEELGIRKVQMPIPALKGNADRLKHLSVGVSVHSLEDVAIAEEYGAKRLIFGNVFETSCKIGKPGAGTEKLKMICNSTELPVYAIGGIDQDNVDSVISSGASGICVMSGLMMSEDPERTISDLRKA